MCDNDSHSVGFDHFKQIFKSCDGKVCLSYNIMAACTATQMQCLHTFAMLHLLLEWCNVYGTRKGDPADFSASSRGGHVQVRIGHVAEGWAATCMQVYLLRCSRLHRAKDTYYPVDMLQRLAA